MSRIKGITIELDGDTKGLDKALSDVNSRSRDVTKELRQVERLLKFNPGNTELIAQKQKLLGDQVANTREKLNKLKDAQAEVQKQFEKGEISEEQYRAFQREIVATESKLKHYESQIEQTQSKLDKFGEKVGETGEKFKDAGDKMTSAGKDMSKKVTAPLMGIAAASIKVGSDFETGMSEVSAISGATGDDLTALENKAREMGATTQFSATESAEALSYMAMAGWETNEMLDGIDGVMALAAASGEDLATTSDIVTDALTAFGMTAADTGQFADVLAAAASNANTDVSMLGESFKNVAPVAGALGLSAEDTSVALGLMANAGIKGGKSGNALKTILSNLAKPTKAMQTEMDNLGLSLTDSEGNMKSLDQIMQEMRGSFADLDEAEKAKAASTIFGKEAMAGALAVINASEEDYNSLSDAINNSDGAAQKMADTMNDNLQGRMKEMKSALEDVAITIYDNLQPALESLVGFVTRLAEWFSELSPTMQNAIVVIGGLAAAIGPLLIVFGAMASGLGAIMTLVSTIIPALSGLGTAFTLLTGPIGIVIAIITALIAIGVALYKNWDVIKEKASDFTDKVVETWGEMMDWFNELPAKFKEIWESVKKSVTDWVKDMVDKAIEVGTDFIKSITEFFDDLPRKMGYWLGETIAKVIIWVADMIAKAKETGSKFIENITEFFKTLPSNVWNWLSETYEKVTTWAVNMWTKANEAGRDFLNKVIEWVRTLPARVQEWLSNTLTRLTTWVTNMGSKGKEAGLDLLNKTVDAVKELPSKMATAGADVVKGFWEGIKSMGSWIKDKVSGFFGGIVDGVKDTLKIKSPSRVFMELGEFTGQGFEEGLLAMSGRVERASRKMAESAILEKSQLTLNNESERSSSAKDSQSRSGGDIIQNITINSPDSMSPAETARQIKNASRQLAMEWGD